MQVQDECKARYEEVEKALAEAERQWRALDERLERAEDAFFASRLEVLRKWFALEEADLASWAPGGLRHSARTRVQGLLILPVVDKMQQQVSFVRPSGEREEAVATRTANRVLDSLFDYWESRVKPVYAEAAGEDAKLTKKIRKTEKDERAQGIVALGMQDTKKVAALKRQRPSIWEASQKALERCVAPVRRLEGFLSGEMPPSMVARIAGAVPVVACRAICDWYFQQYLIESDQLEKWWSNTKATLQQREALWSALHEQEGLLLRRIEAGIEDLTGGRRTYTTLANFGGTEIEVMSLLSSTGAGGLAGDSSRDSEIPPNLEEAVTLLAHVVSDMVRRLRAIRDSALWRVIEAAQTIHRQLSEDASPGVTSPWQAVQSEEGLLVFLEVLDEGCAGLDASVSSDAPSSPSRQPPSMVDMALVVMRRLENLGALAADLRQNLSSPSGGGVGAAPDMDAALSQVAAAAAALNEDLLALIDEPTTSAAEAWLRLWESGLEGAASGQSLDVLMGARNLCSDSNMGPTERRARRRWLTVLRGLQVFLDDQSLRAEVVAPLSHLVAPPSPGARAALLRSPSSMSVAPAEGAQDAEAELSLLATPPAPNLALSSLALPGGGYPYRPPQRRFASKTGAPVDELVLEAPPRPSFVGGWQPDAPATPTGEAGSLGRSASGRFINGQFANPRPNSAGMRLPPLEIKPQ